MNQHEFFYDIAKAAAKQSTCLRRRYGSVIVNPKTNTICGGGTGYNGSPRKKEHCTDKKWCLREELEVPQGERYELSCCLHSEQNAIINATCPTQDCVLYLYGEAVNTNYPIIAKPCFICTKMLINAGIHTVITKVNNTFIEMDMDELYDKYLIEMVQNHYPED